MQSKANITPGAFLNPEVLIEIYRRMFEGVDEILPSDLTPEARLAGTQISAEIWNDTVNGLRRICANLLENLKAHEDGVDEVIRTFIKEVNEYLEQALGEFSTEFTDWLKQIQYFDVKEIGDGIQDYRLYFTFGTAEDPTKYQFTTPNLIQYNQIWIVYDSQGNKTPEPVIPVYDENGDPVYDDTGHQVYRPCWVIKIDSKSNKLDTPITLQKLQELLGKVQLDKGESPVFDQLDALYALLDPTDLTDKLPLKGTVANRLNLLEANDALQDNLLDDHTQHLNALDQKFVDLGDTADLVKAIEVINDVQLIKEVLDFKNLWDDYNSRNLGTVYQRLNALEQTVKSQTIDIKALQNCCDANKKAIDILKQESVQYNNRLQSLENKLKNSNWQIIPLSNSWAKGSYIAYKKRNGFIELRVYLITARDFTSINVHGGAQLYVARFPEAYRPDDYTDVQVYTNLYTNTGSVGQGALYLVSGPNEVYYIQSDGKTVSKQPARDTDGCLYLRLVAFNGRTAPLKRGTVITGGTTFIARHEEV